MLSPRGAYITLLKSRRNPSIEQTRQAYLGRNSNRRTKIAKSGQGNSEPKHQSNPKTDRQRANPHTSLNRQSTSRQDSKMIRREVKLKSSMNTWSKTCISLQTKVKSSHQQQMIKNQQGENCRVVIMHQGKAQQEHFLKVQELSQVRDLLFKAYPRADNFLTVPRQIPLEYMFTKSGIPGDFLNGQSLYMKIEAEKNKKNGNVRIEDFEIIKQVGSGGFSKVFLVRSKIDNQFYAMKLIEKQMVIRNKKKKIVMNERNIMVSSKHPFVIDLKYSFEAEKYIVFIMEFCAGGELFGLIKKYRRLTEEIAKFYIIEILLGLAYLHGQNVVYRDIKPENILLGIDGHVKIADLGLAKPDMGNGQLAYSFCGSPEYMSPQMIMQLGHTFPVDYYCMGALLYELVTGLPPFYSQDPNQIYEAVLVEELVFPQDCDLTQECKSLLKSLLCKDPKHRLGSLYGTKQILSHPWFGKQNYQKYLNKQVEPPMQFRTLDRIGLDTENDKHRESLEKVIRDQKNQKQNFKEILKNFYHGKRENLESRHSRSRRPESANKSGRSMKSVEKDRRDSQRGKENEEVRRTKKKMPGMVIRTPLYALIQK